MRLFPEARISNPDGGYFLWLGSMPASMAGRSAPAPSNRGLPSPRGPLLQPGQHNHCLRPAQPATGRGPHPAGGPVARNGNLLFRSSTVRLFLTKSLVLKSHKCDALSSAPSRGVKCVFAVDVRAVKARHLQPAERTRLVYPASGPVPGTGGRNLGHLLSGADLSAGSGGQNGVDILFCPEWQCSLAVRSPAREKLGSALGLWSDPGNLRNGCRPGFRRSVAFIQRGLQPGILASPMTGPFVHPQTPGLSPAPQLGHPGSMLPLRLSSSFKARAKLVQITALP